MVDRVLSSLGASSAELVAAAIAGVAIYLTVIVATRVAGLRSFSKMSAFDFAMTVAVGSLIASAASGGSSLAGAFVGVVSLFTLQFTVARLRRRDLLRGTVDNSPMLLVRDGGVVDANLRAARVTADDLRASLRAANVLDPRRVHAVVMETTGDLSVLHGDGDLDPELLQGVRLGPGLP